MPQMSIKDKTMQILEMDDDERGRQMQAHFMQLEQSLIQNINAVVAQAMSQIGSALQTVRQELRQSRAEIAALKKPANMKIDNIQTDGSGRITSAEINASV